MAAAEAKPAIERAGSGRKASLPSIAGAGEAKGALPLRLADGAADPLLVADKPEAKTASEGFPESKGTAATHAVEETCGPGGVGSDATDSSAAATVRKMEPMSPVSPVGFKTGVETVYSPKPVKRKGKKPTDSATTEAKPGGLGNAGTAGGLLGGAGKVAPVTTQLGRDVLKPSVEGALQKSSSTSALSSMRAAVSSGALNGEEKKPHKKPPRTGPGNLDAATGSGGVKKMVTMPAAESQGLTESGSGVIKSLRSFQGVSSTIMNINKLFTLGKKEEPENKYRVHQHAHFTRDIQSHGSFRPEELGMTAYATGPFMERAMVFHVSPTPNLELGVGRYCFDAAFTNDIRFQDHSVGKDACEIVFKRNRKGFRLKCADPAGVAVAYLDDSQEPHCQLVADQEEIDVGFCSAIRFGRHSWVTLAPFVPSVLLLHGRYTREGAADGRYEKIAAYISKPFSTIGNDRGNTVNFPGFNVSERHCHIFKTDAGFYIVDSGSKAGTYINGIRVLPPTGMLLFPGACITFGPPELKQELVVHVNANLDRENQCDWAIEVEEKMRFNDG